MKPIKIKTILGFFVFFIMTLTITIAQNKKTSQVTFEENTNRPGKDYKSVVLNDADPNQCVRLCENDAKCKAFTYVKPGVQGPKAVCWLKNEVPNPLASNDCVSGVRIQLQNQVKAVRKVDTSTNPIVGRRGQIDAIPIPITVPKPVLPTTRFEIIQDAISIPQIKNQLAQIAKSRGMNLKAINTITLSGKPALNQIYTGDGSDVKNDNKEKEAPGIFNSPGEVDWSGGIQLSPKSLKSNARFWSGKEKIPVAKMAISDIALSYYFGLDDVNKKNTVLIDEGRIYISLVLPDINPELYLVTLELNPTHYSKLGSTKVLYTTSNKSLLYNFFELIQSSDKTKYIGVVKLVGVEDQNNRNQSNVYINLEQGESAFFSGVTFTKY